MFRQRIRAFHDQSKSSYQGELPTLIRLDKTSSPNFENQKTGFFGTKCQDSRMVRRARPSRPFVAKVQILDEWIKGGTIDFCRRARD